jgi:hypothetical protein
MPRKIQALIVAIAFMVAFGSLAMAQHPRATLHERAKKADGRLVWRYRPNRSVIYSNVEELAKRSDIIVVGRAIGQRPRMRPDGNFITEDFQVRVQDVIKGDLPSGQSIVVSMPGGAQRFRDGSVAAVIPTGVRRAEKGGTYFFFLRAKRGKSAFKGYLLASATQGLFALKEGRIEPADRVASDPVVAKYQGMSLGDFLRQVHMAAPRKKKTTSTF